LPWLVIPRPVGGGGDHTTRDKGPMTFTNLHSELGRRTRRQLRRLAAGIGVGAIACMTLTTGPAGAEFPSEIAGNPHSPRVAGLATKALDAKVVFETTGEPADRKVYLAALEGTATATASEMGVSQLQMTAAWLATDPAHQTAVLTALTQLGVEYQSATSEPGVGFDCSGLMYYAWGEAGFELARQSGSQISEAETREMDSAKAGDLAQYPGHVMMYLGVPRAFVHSSNPENDVELWLTSDDRAAGLRYGDPTN
jgi:cell wall-associated NlpC family hydrolase